MSHLEQNVSCLLKRYPLYQSKIKNVSDESLQKYSIKEDQFFEGERCIEKPHQLDGEELLAKEGSTVVVFGLGFGFLIEQLRKKNIHVIVVEPSVERFMFWLSMKDRQSSLDDRHILWLVGMTDEESFPYLYRYLAKRERSVQMDSMEFLFHPVLTKMYSSYFDRIKDEIKTVIKLIYVGWGTREDSLFGFKHVVENSSFISNSPGIMQLKDRFKGVPAIIVSTGPSLSKALPFLKNVGDKALLFSADASLKILWENNIDPHFVSVIERDGEPAPFFEKLPRNTSFKTELVTYPLTMPNVLQSFKGNKWVLYRDYAYFYFLEKQLPKGIVSSGSSVAHMNLKLAHYLGCSPIVLVGQDLAYDPDTLASHPEGIAYEEWSQHGSIQKINEQLKAKDAGEVIWVEGNLRDKVPTNSLYYIFLKEFTSEALTIAQKGATVINATAGGARIPGVAYQELSSLIQSWPARPELQKIISDQRINNSEEQIPWQLVVEGLEPLLSRWEKLEATVNELRSSSTLGEASLELSWNVLDKARKALTENELFASFVIQNAGGVYLKIENELNQQGTFAHKLVLMSKWLEHLKGTLVGVLSILRSASSAKESDAS